MVTEFRNACIPWDRCMHCICRVSNRTINCEANSRTDQRQTDRPPAHIMRQKMGVVAVLRPCTACANSLYIYAACKRQTILFKCHAVDIGDSCNDSTSTNDARLQTCVRCSSPCDFQPQIETETRRYNTKSTDDSPQIRFRMQLPRSSLQTGRARYKHIEECLYTAVGRRTHKMFIPNGMTSPDKFLLKHAESHGTDTICLLSYVSKTTLSSQLASGPSIRRLGSPHEQELASTSPPNYACAGSALVSSPARRIHQRYFACRIV